MSETYDQSAPLRVRPTARVTKGDRRRAQILDASLDFLWSRPFRELTVSSLMAGTGASRSAFYVHFRDMHDVMETLLRALQREIFDATEVWFAGVGHPAASLREALAGLVRVCYERGPILRAVTAAATSDERFEKDWSRFMLRFDDAVAERIEADQAQGLIADFDARPIAVALNRLDAYTLIHEFGQHPRSEPDVVLEGLARIWISTLYGTGQLGKKSSTLIRK